MKKPFSLSQQERLKSRKQIETLFLQGEAFFVFPYRVRYMLNRQQPETGIRFGVSIPKRNFKKAVDRNRLKRLTRETYRLQKHKLEKVNNTPGACLHLMFYFSHKEMLTYTEIEKGMSAALKKMASIVHERLTISDQ